MRNISKSHASYLSKHFAPMTTENTYFEALAWINDCTPALTIATSCRLAKLHDLTGTSYRRIDIEGDTLEDAVVRAVGYIVDHGLMDNLTIDEVNFMEGKSNE